MMRTYDLQARTGLRLLILAALGLVLALLVLLSGALGVTPEVPAYAASPLLPPTLLAPPDSAVISDTTPTLSWVASPPPATGYYLKVDGWTKNVGAATSGEPNPLGDGPHSWTVSSYDGLGGESDDAPAWSFTVDTQPPPPPVLQSPSNGSATSNTSVTVEWAASVGAAGYRLNWNGSVSDVGNSTWHVLNSLADGTYSWSVAAYDAVGNVSAYPTVWTVRVDTTPPAPPALTSPANEETIVDPTPTLRWAASVEAAGYWVRLDGDETDVGSTTSWTAPLLGAGAHTWSVAAYDQLGNRSAYTDTWSFTLEIVPPVPPVLVYPANGAVISDTTPTLTWEEVPGAVDYWLAWGGGWQEVGDHLFYTVSAPEGTHSWSVASVNGLGRMSQFSDPYTFTVDITPPPVPVLASPASGSILSTSTPLLSWVASPGAAGYYIKWDGVAANVGDTTTYTPTAADGPHTWTVAAYDPVHNVSAYTDTWSLTIDTTPPAVPELQDPPDGSVLATDTIVLSWAAATDAVGYVVEWDGTPVDVGDVLSHTVSTVDGPHTWRVAAYDHVRNTSAYAAAWTVTADTTPPPVPDLLSPADGSVLSTSTPLLSWTAVVDAVGYVVKWDGTAIDVGNETSYAVPTLDGPHTWTVAAYDHVDNLSAYTDTWSLTVDTTPPPVPALVSPADGAVLTSTAVVLSWNAATDAVGYVVEWDGTPVDVGDVLSHTVSTMDGTHTWTVAAYDHVDNLSANADPRSLRVDTTPPTVDSTVPDDGATEVAPTAQLAIHFSEAVETGTLEVTVSPDPGGWTATWSADHQVVTLSHAAFRVTTAYTVTVTTVVDLAGLAMEESYSWSFETGMYGLYLPLVMRAYAP